MVDHAVATFGRVDALYNNAGIMPAADHSVIDTDVETWDKVMAVNVRGVYLGCKYAIPKMVEQGSGSIINVASFVAILGCSVPAGRLHRVEGRGPGADRRAWPSSSRRRASGRTRSRPARSRRRCSWTGSSRTRRRRRSASPATRRGRFGKPEEIVHVAVYLASDESRWTNGANLVIDGGITVNYF